jgi:hypothetical protein
MPMKTGQKAINPKTGLPYTAQETAEQQKRQAEDLKNRSAKVTEIDDAITAAKRFNLLDKSSLKDGTYTLDKVITYFKYMSPDVRIYREHGIQNSKLTDGTAMTTGFVASLSDGGRFFEIPLKFIVDRSQNQDWTAAGDAAFPQVVNLKSTVKQTKNMTHDLEDYTDDLDLKARAKASVANMLVNGTLTNDGAYYTKDENGREVYMRLLNVSESRLNVSFDVVESKEPLKARTIVLSYAIEKKMAAAQATGNTTAQAQQTTTQDGQLAPEQAAGNEQLGAAPTGDSATPPSSAVPGVDDDQAQH